MLWRVPGSRLTLSPFIMKRLSLLLVACVTVAVGGYAVYRVRSALPAHAAWARPLVTVPVRPSRSSTATSAAMATESSPSSQTATPALFPNIAAAALGGDVEWATSTSEQRGWAADNLLDGGSADLVCSPYCSWLSKDATFPQEVVLSFNQHREAVVARVVLDTITPLTRLQTIGAPRDVEVWASSLSGTDGFTRVAVTRLPEKPGQHPVEFQPVRARFLKVRLLSMYGTAPAVTLGEISAFEAAGSSSVVADLPRNLAAPAFGGVIVSYTSEYAIYGAWRLVDGNPAVEWRSDDEYLPQTFLFAFRDDRVAFVDRVVLSTPEVLLRCAPKTVAVEVSVAGPAEGFEEVGRFTLKRESGEQTLPIHREARYLKVRILETFTEKPAPGAFAALGEVQVLEGDEPGHRSILSSSPPAAVAQPNDRAVTQNGDSSGDVEREPNNTPPEANALRLDTEMRGLIDPVAEADYFSVSVPGAGQRMLSVQLSERPFVRTSMDLIEGSGATVKEFEPSQSLPTDTSFSWMIPAGDYKLKLTEPPASVVLAWDTSGSMQDSVGALAQAVNQYIDQLPSTQQVCLMRFSDRVEVLLPEFTSDKQRLKKAAEGKFFADGATPFYDAVLKAAELLKGRGGNRAIIVMTDGEDSGSRIHRPEFWRSIVEKGIRLYTIGLGDMDHYSLQLATSPHRLLAHAAAATRGRTFFATDSSKLADFYRDIAAELAQPCSYRIHARVAQAAGTLRVQPIGERAAAIASPPAVELILDASGSMKRRIGREPMIESAKRALAGIVDELPDGVQVALRVYGHRLPEGRPGACADSELVFPFAPVDKQRLVARIRAVRALGTTPIAYSLAQVGYDFGSTSGEKIVILVTDGKEECGGNPDASIARLAASGVQIRLNIVGFALGDERLKADLARLAEKTKGRFIAADDAGSLRDAIEQSMSVPFDVLDAAGAQVATGMTGRQEVSLPEGIYRVVVHAADKPIELPAVRITAHQATTVELRSEGRETGTRVLTGGTP